MAADVNRDGKIDLVAQVLTYGVFGEDSGPFCVLFGTGDGSFTIGPAFSPSVWSNFLAIDVDRDGVPDLVVRSGDGKSSVKFGKGDGGFRDGPPLPVGGDTGMAADDFDRDGIVDLAVSHGGAVVILLGNGDGTFRELTRIPTQLSGDIWTTDLNGDGWTDLVLQVGGYPLPRVLLLFAQGDGRFQNPVELSGGHHRIETIADLNSDGRPDLLVTNWDTRLPWMFLNTSPARLAQRPVVSAAGFATAGIAPNMLISIYGSFLADATRLDRTKVRINGAELKLLYVSAAQINALVGPSPGFTGPGRLQVESPAGLLEAEINVVEYAPAIFLLSPRATEGLFLHSDGTLVTSRSPARVGETITILCTGLGRIGESPQVKIGDAQGMVRSFGVAPMGPLVNTVEFVIPSFTPPPNGAMLPVQLTIGGVGSNTVTITVE